MGFWAYYSPFWLGALLFAGGYLHTADRTASPLGLHLLTAFLGGLGAGVLLQLLMFGAQGAFAQVLPVPAGRSLRGRPAVVAGFSLLLSIGAAAVAWMLYAETLHTAAWIAGILAAGAALGALITYLWGLPAAVQDFRDPPTGSLGNQA